MRMLVDNLLLPAPVEADPDFSEVSSRALASATRSIDVNNDFARWVRRLIGKSGRPHTDDELHMVMTALIGTAQGEPPEEHDVEALSSLLTAFGGHGLLESINDGVPPVLASLDEWRTALETSVQDQFDLPSDITLGELEQARTLCTNLGLIMSLVPRESMHYLGGPALTSLWQPDNPQRLAQILIWAVNAQRAGRIDAEPMFAAAREVGWLPPNE
ncbi:MAG TPA: hypothetical protein VF557_10210 [Jatrophihabitans sp.]|jgi:hypothetical protein|uniref:hypothetical protein n=1 Tax=Jatrophihabitans sp. TaxID=1932789 RepID=UPI002F04BB3C